MTTLVWLRRDLRLYDNPALALAQGPVIPVFILDPETEAWGAAARWRLEAGLTEFARTLEARGSRLILRRGPALEVLTGLKAETGADTIRWNRAFDPASVDRDRGVKAALPGAVDHPANLIAEPGDLATGAGGGYRVFTPFWRALRARGAAEAAADPDLVPAARWPRSDTLAGWDLGRAVRQGAPALARHAQVGEAAARRLLSRFVRRGMAGYERNRDRLDTGGGSGLSDHLALGEISARQVWHTCRAAMLEGAAGADRFMAQLAWRDFAAHLHAHFPLLAETAWRRGWDAFPWRGESGAAEAWRQGCTGVDLVDAAMRQLWVTGRMHNRLRMVTASYLTKHLLTDWRIGLRWFADCLTDWDPSSNAMGWQWVAGSGPDAAPWFRIFNPDAQAERFDPEAKFRSYWLRGAGAEQFHAIRPASWRQFRPPRTEGDLASGRLLALEAHAAFTRRNSVA
jgi:deoxyribodipyrimidine photo-lyase